MKISSQQQAMQQVAERLAELANVDHGELRLKTDYIHGRSMKTDVTIRSDGSITLTTWGRGQSALRWLDRLQGKKRLAVVPTVGPETSSDTLT